MAKMTPYSFKKTNFFTGSYNTSNANLKYIDPFITGYAKIIWTKIPSWVESVYPEFKSFTQGNFKSFGGISDMELATASVTQGFNSNELHFASGTQKQNTEFTLKHQEFSGSPVRKMYTHWVKHIRDPETGIASYAKKYNLEYSAANHTGELLYVVLRPDANNVTRNVVEFAAYYTNVLPKRIPLGHLNHENGSHDQVEIEIPFSGDFHMSAAVDAYALEKINQTYAFETIGNFKPADVKGAGGYNASDND